MSYFLVALVIGTLILLHELGHFVAARWAGIPVARFSIGFGPLWWKFKRNGTEFGLAWFPFGGYVLPDLEDDESFLRIPAAKRVLFSLGGPIANLLTAVVLYAALNIVTGNATLMHIFVTPWLQTGGLFCDMIAAIPSIFSQPSQLSGVVGIVAQGQQYVGTSLERALEFSIVLSINLAVLNMLPLPALDGGKILLAGAEKIWPASRRWHLHLAIASWVFLIGLMLYATLMDVIRVSA